MADHPARVQAATQDGESYSMDRDLKEFLRGPEVLPHPDLPGGEGAGAGST